jgi:hypothetical protein
MTSNGNGSDDFIISNIPSISLAQVYKPINPLSLRYLVGWIGTAKLLIVATG